MGFWDDDCPECYEALVRDHVVDMEFIPFDENGRIITAVILSHAKNIYFTIILRLHENTAQIT